MSIHIGKIIKETLKSKNIDVADFAYKINYTRGNAYKIFNKKSIDTELLTKISKVLRENLFFHFIAEDELINYKNEQIPPLDILNAIQDLKSTILSMNSPKQKANKNEKK